MHIFHGHLKQSHKNRWNYEKIECSYMFETFIQEGIQLVDRKDQ